MRCCAASCECSCTKQKYAARCDELGVACVELGRTVCDEMRAKGGDKMEMPRVGVCGGTGADIRGMLCM